MTNLTNLTNKQKKTCPRAPYKIGLMSPYKSANRHHNHTKTKLCEKTIIYDPFIGYIIQQHINVIRLLTGKY